MLAAFEGKVAAIEAGQRLDEIADLRQQPDAGVCREPLVAAGACAMINVVGGFIITDRMLKMFKRADKPEGGK